MHRRAVGPSSSQKLILLAIAPLFITSVKSNYAANEYTSIHNIARDRLEQLMSLPFNDAQLNAANSPFSNDLPTNLRSA